MPARGSDDVRKARGRRKEQTPKQGFGAHSRTSQARLLDVVRNASKNLPTVESETTLQGFGARTRKGPAFFAALNVPLPSRRYDSKRTCFCFFR